MADQGVLRVPPEAMQTASQALSGASKDLRTRLTDLDAQVREMLTGWQGGSGGAYTEVWDLWHKGAADVQLGLAILAKAVGNAGIQFQAQDAASQQTIDGVYHG